MVPMHADEVAISEADVVRLLEAQMPDLASRPLRRVEPWGTDNAIWRLGDDLVLRFPRIEWAQRQIALEAEWLPRLAPHLTVEIPEPVAVGAAGSGYPFPWAVHRWIPGVGAAPGSIEDETAFAFDLARVMQELWAAPAAGGPPARNRARPLRDFDADTRRAIDVAAHLIDAAAATAVWEEALAAPPHDGAPVWVHADLEGNCLVRDGRLCGLVDWGSACVGDPAVDVQVVWSPLIDASTRALFLGALDVDEATLARSRGMAVNQACAALPYYLGTYPLIVERSWHKLAALGVDPVS